jgi:peptidoglycan/xylan/chitin deacetylase (PgdA/CDA1 family)
MRRLLFLLVEILGVNALFRLSHRNSLTIVLYHGVAPAKQQGIYNYRGKFITPSAFREQLVYFKRHYTILELDEAVRRMREGNLPRHALAITFDDGYRNVYTYAYPVLKEMSVPATMFLPTDFVLEKKPLWVDRLEYAMGRTEGSFAERAARDAETRDELKRLGIDERERRLADIERASGTAFTDFSGERSVYAPLTQDEIREMRAGGISFGAHTKTHPILSRINSEEALRDEIAGSKGALEQAIGPLSNIFAYPNGQRGDWDERAERILEDARFVSSLTTVEGVSTKHTHPFRLKRYALDATDNGWVFAAIASGVRLWLRTLKNHAH